VELFQEAEFWVGVAFLIFIGLMVWMKVPGVAMKVLDARAEKIRAELAEAERLRKEAEALLASIRARREAAEKQAAELLANAEAEAKQLEAEAHARLEEQVRRRGEIAKAKIAQAETQATAEVKAAAAELAVEAAASLLARRAQGLKTDPLVDQAMGDLSARLQ
jgi:F-type H+-transporting ATPase subunit b